MKKICIQFEDIVRAMQAAQSHSKRHATLEIHHETETIVFDAVGELVVPPFSGRIISFLCGCACLRTMYPGDGAGY